MKPTIGRIVLYVLSSDDADSINRHFDHGLRHGNRVAVGDILPLVICRVWNPELYGGRESINGQVILDAPFSHWVTSVHPCPDQTPGTWHWPQIPPKPGGDSLGRMDAELSGLPARGVQIAPPGVEIIRQCQHILARYLPPDGITEQRCINELLGILDGPEANALTLEPCREAPRQGQALADAETLARSLCELIEGAGASDELTACSIRASQLLAHLQEAQSSQSAKSADHG